MGMFRAYRNCLHRIRFLHKEHEKMLRVWLHELYVTGSYHITNKGYIADILLISC